MYTRRFALLLVIAAISIPLFAQSNDDPVALLQGAALLGRFDSLEARLTMEITDSRGTKDRGLVAYVERTDESSKALVQVVSPAFLGNLKFLSIASGDDRDQWMSTSRGVRRISGGSGNERIFDSDFTVEDLASYDPEDYTLSLKGSEQRNGETCHVLEAVPVGGVTGDRKVLYIGQDTGLLQAGEFYEDGQLHRVFELVSSMLLNGVLFPEAARMETPGEGTYTVLTVTEAETGKET